MQDIYNYENKYNIKLPEEYIFFLTQVGNGGAGPYYGLYPLEELAKHNPHHAYISNPSFINAHLTKDKWKIIY